MSQPHSRLEPTIEELDHDAKSLKTYLFGGETRYFPHCPWLEVTDVAFDFRTSRIRTIVYDDDDLTDKLNSLPALEPGTARIFDVTRSMYSDDREVAKSTKVQFKDYLKTAHGIEGVYADAEIKMEGFPDHRSVLFQTRRIEALWDELRPQQEMLIPVIVADVRSEKQFHSLGHSFGLTNLMCSLNSDDRLVVINTKIGASNWTPGIGPSLLSNRWVSTSPGTSLSRQSFAKLTAVMYFRQHIANLTKICHQTYPSIKHEMLYRESADIEAITLCLRNSKEFCQYAKELTDALDFVLKRLEPDLSIENGSPMQRRLAEFLNVVRSEADNLINISTNNHDKLQLGWDAYRDILSVRESRNVKALTVLAAVFLPLSLSSSVLAMSTRLQNLGILLYDFVGVFLILSSAAVVMYFVILAFGYVARGMRNLKSRTELKEQAERSDLAQAYTKLYAFRPHPKTVVTLLAVIWLVITASFIVGMIGDHDMGVNMFIYTLVGVAALLGILLVVMLVTFILWCFKANVFEIIGVVVDLIDFALRVPVPWLRKSTSTPAWSTVEDGLLFL